MKGKNKDTIIRLVWGKPHEIAFSWKCDICGLVFEKYQLMKAHKITNHTYSEDLPSSSK